MTSCVRRLPEGNSMHRHGASAARRAPARGHIRWHAPPSPPAFMHPASGAAEIRSLQTASSLFPEAKLRNGTLKPLFKLRKTNSSSLKKRKCKIQIYGNEVREAIEGASPPASIFTPADQSRCGPGARIRCRGSAARLPRRSIARGRRCPVR